MFSLQRLFGQDKKFFTLLQGSAHEAQTSIQALKRVMAGQASPGLAEFSAARRKDKQITGEITEMLCRTFVTALEREDIEDLATALYKVPKTTEKFAERYLISYAHTRDVDFSAHMKLLEQAIETVILMLNEVEASNLQRLQELNQALQKIEAEGDQLICQLTGELYAGKYDPLKAIILKDLYELLEKALDRCRSAGNVMSRVALKHS
jgi:uncharacterized protein Yka (UPF0111/DUF47 family)